MNYFFLLAHLTLFGSQKINRINVVNPTGFSRRTAWTLLSQLITALAKKQAAAVNECYGIVFVLNKNPNVMFQKIGY